MTVKKKKEEEPQSRPATSPEARENQLINLAVSLAEKQLRDGTASPSVITHFIKLASTRERLERDILEKNSRLIDAKAKNLDKDRESEEVAKAAVEAMKNYKPSSK